MTNDINIISSQWSLSQDVEKWARITTYRLHYSTNFISLYLRHLIIHALIDNETYDILTDDEIACLKLKAKSGKISVTKTGGCGCGS